MDSINKNVNRDLLMIRSWLTPEKNLLVKLFSTPSFMSISFALKTSPEDLQFCLQLYMERAPVGKLALVQLAVEVRTQEKFLILSKSVD